MNLDRILCIKTERVLKNDFPVNHDKKLYQVLNYVVARKVTINESVTGSVFITNKGKRLKHKEIFPIKRKKVKNKTIKTKNEIKQLGIKDPIEA